MNWKHNVPPAQECSVSSRKGGEERRRWGRGGEEGNVRRWGGEVWLMTHCVLVYRQNQTAKLMVKQILACCPLRLLFLHCLFINSGCSSSIWAEPPMLYFLPLLVQCMHNRYTVKTHNWIHEVLGLIKHCVTKTVSANTDCSLEYIQRNCLHLKMLQKCLDQQESLNR